MTPFMTHLQWNHRPYPWRYRSVYSRTCICRGSTVSFFYVDRREAGFGEGEAVRIYAVPVRAWVCVYYGLREVRKLQEGRRDGVLVGSWLRGRR